MVLGAVIGVAPLLAYNDLAFGSPLEQGYGVKTFATPIQTGLYGLLASPSRGLLVYTPYLIFAFIASLIFFMPFPSWQDSLPASKSIKNRRPTPVANAS